MPIAHRTVDRIEVSRVAVSTIADLLIAGTFFADFFPRKSAKIRIGLLDIC